MYVCPASGLDCVVYGIPTDSALGVTHARRACLVPFAVRGLVSAGLLPQSGSVSVRSSVARLP